MNPGERPRTQPNTPPPQWEGAHSALVPGHRVPPSGGAPALSSAAHTVWWGNRGSTDLGHRGHRCPFHRGRCVLAPRGERPDTPRSRCLPLPLLPRVASPRHRCRSTGQAPPCPGRAVPGRGPVRSVEPRAGCDRRWAGTKGCQKARPGSPHHNRTRSSGEQRGVTLKTAQPTEATSRVGVSTSPAAPQLPEPTFRHLASTHGRHSPPAGFGFSATRCVRGSVEGDRACSCSRASKRLEP